jgi:small subunit ribosomal protein S15
MPLAKDAKAEIFKEYSRHEGDTGSPEVQIVMLTTRISQLTEHLKIHKHDEHSRRGLLKLVGQRLRHLKYLSKKNPESYKALIERLGLRDYVKR